MATGTEMALAALFKLLGVDPKETVNMVLDARDRVVRVDNSLAEFRAEQKSQRELLESINAKLEAQDGRTPERPIAERADAKPAPIADAAE